MLLLAKRVGSALQRNMIKQHVGRSEGNQPTGCTISESGPRLAHTHPIDHHDDGVLAEFFPRYSYLQAADSSVPQRHREFQCVHQAFLDVHVFQHKVTCRVNGCWMGLAVVWIA